MKTDMKLERVAVMYPSGNTTAILFPPVDVSDTKALNARVMGAWKALRPKDPGVEQVCYITRPRDSKALTRVEMLGGEFCGNATRSVISLLMAGRDGDGTIEVSGVEKPLAFFVSKGVTKLEMPFEETDMLTPIAEGVLVRLQGIIQLVASAKARRACTPRELLENILENKKYKLRDEPAVGVTYFDPTSRRASFAVWVNAVDTTFDETACGSGTAAIGAVIAKQAGKSQKIKITQPSNEWITVSAEYDTRRKEVRRVWIKGKVRTLFDNALVV